MTQKETGSSEKKDAMLATPMNGRGIEVRTLGDLKMLAAMVMQSGFAPHFKDPVQVAIAIQTGAELGLTPMASLRGIAVINGRPCIYGDAGTALVRASGLLARQEEWYDGERGEEDYTACCKLWRRGVETPTIGTFSIADAKRAGLLSKRGPWQEYPARMLMWRARTYAFRDGFADVLQGITFREEVEDIEPRDASDTASVSDYAPVEEGDPAAAAREVEHEEGDGEPVSAHPGQKEIDF